MCTAVRVQLKNSKNKEKWCVKQLCFMKLFLLRMQSLVTVGLSLTDELERVKLLDATV